MKNYLLLLLICCLALVGCNAKEKAVAERLEIKGIITGIDIEGNRILVDDPDTGFIWLALPAHDDIKKYEEGLEVKVWIDGGIDTSSPAYAKAFMIKLLEEQFILHKFDFKNNEFPPYPYGFVEIDETRYEMATGGFKWTTGNQTVQTDAASPAQITENFNAIVVDANSKVNMDIEQSPNVSVYLWDYERKKMMLEGNELTVPATSGHYIYEVVAKWSNGEVSYIFVVDVNE